MAHWDKTQDAGKGRPWVKERLDKVRKDKIANMQ